MNRSYDSLDGARVAARRIELNLVHEATPPVWMLVLSCLGVMACGDAQHNQNVGAGGSAGADGTSHTGAAGAAGAGGDTAGRNVEAGIDTQARLPTEVATGASASCAVLDETRVSCWGIRLYGLFNIGMDQRPTVFQLKPQVVQEFDEPIEQLSVAGRHACALLESGSVECWGFDGSGQAGGRGNVLVRTTPAKVDLAGPAVSVAAADEHSCAVLKDGSIWCWGHDGALLGNGDWDAWFPEPTRVAPASLNAISISSGYQSACALTREGRVYCWGVWVSDVALAEEHTEEESDFDYDYYVHLAPRLIPDLVGEKVVDVSVGAAHACALLADGSVRCWGSNVRGALGSGEDIESCYQTGAGCAHDTPVAVSGLSGPAIQIEAGARSSCVLLEDKSVQCWGEGQWGALGNGVGLETDCIDATSCISAKAVPVLGLDFGVRQISLRSYHGCGSRDDASIWCWGAGWYGQLGRNTVDSSSVAKPVSELR